MGSEGSRLAESERGVWFLVEKVLYLHTPFQQEERARALPGAKSFLTPTFWSPEQRLPVGYTREAHPTVRPDGRPKIAARDRLLRARERDRVTGWRQGDARGGAGARGRGPASASVRGVFRASFRLLWLTNCS